MGFPLTRNVSLPSYIEGGGIPQPAGGHFPRAQGAFRGNDSLPARPLERLRKTFARRRDRDIAWRRGRLQALRRIEREPQIVAAVHADFGKPFVDTQLAETARIPPGTPEKLRWIDRPM